MKKAAFFISLFVVIIIGYEVYKDIRHKDKLVIVFCDVGQGDGAFIKTPRGRQIIIDTGPGASILKCMSSNMPFWDKTIDLIILSHFNTDHVGGTIDILNRYQVKRIAVPTVSTQRDDVKKYMTLFQDKKISVDDLDINDTYKIEDDVKIITLGPSTQTGLLEENDSSLIQLLSYGSYDVLFTGDASYRIVNPILDKLGNSVEVFKVPHHGSKTGLNEESFKKFQPQTAIISSGQGNSYGHPNKEVLDLLLANEIEVRRTDQEGSIRFVLD